MASRLTRKISSAAVPVSVSDTVQARPSVALGARSTRPASISRPTIAVTALSFSFSCSATRRWVAPPSRWITNITAA